MVELVFSEVSRRGLIRSGSWRLLTSSEGCLENRDNNLTQFLLVVVSTRLQLQIHLNLSLQVAITYPILGFNFVNFLNFDSTPCLQLQGYFTFKTAELSTQLSIIHLLCSNYKPDSSSTRLTSTLTSTRRQLHLYGNSKPASTTTLTLP